jgi:GMP synthase-like glutamine amidotransferase
VKTLAVIQHTSAEYLGLIEDHLEGRRIRFRYFRPFTAGGRLPSLEQCGDGVILLGGGPWGLTPGPGQLPRLEEEVALVRQLLPTGRPVIGIGLGALILARAAGGDGRAAALAFEVGTATRTEHDALAGYLPARYPIVRYGRDEVVLPAGARVLARDEHGGPALFQLGERAFGFLAHPGVKSAMIEDLIMEFPEAPSDPEPGLAALRRERPALEAALIAIMTGLVQCTGLMEPDAATPP